MEDKMKWIKIEKLPHHAGKKTEMFEVWNILDKCSLGIIKWKANWRKYAFFPYVGSYFEQDCLRDIADFIQAETKRYKKDWIKL